tara:strand:- start:10464 stop:11708 length:1245 start_codon:yes stop_codon:yes gene_type:complete
MINKKTKILFYYDTKHSKNLFCDIADKLSNSLLISQKSIKSIKGIHLECSEIVNDIENDYARYLRFKYDTPNFSIWAIIKKWQRLGFSENSLQRKYRRFLIKKKFQKWVNFFQNSNFNIVAGWCPIKPKRNIVFEAARFCKKSLLFFEDSPIPGFIICDHKGINGGLSFQKDINFYINNAGNRANKINIDLNQLFNGITQRSPISKKYKPKKNEPEYLKKNIIYCPLQVQDDTQIVRYGSWVNSVQKYIKLMHEASRFLPSNWQLVIREHPSCSISFSKKLIELSDDKFSVNNNTDSTQLIKLSKAVVTINSSVGFHSLLKNKPVIVCGDAFWGFEPIAHVARNKSELFDKFSNINFLKTDINAIEKYMHFLLNQKFISTYYANGAFEIDSEGLDIILNCALKSHNYYSEIYRL